MKALKQNIWILFMILGVIGFGIVWFAMPHNSAIPNFGVLGFKFLVFGFIIFGIGFFPNEFKLRNWLLLGPILVYLCYIIPRMSYFSLVVTEKDEFIIGEAYTILYLICYPMVVFSMAFAYRIGGGTPGKTIKFCVEAMILLFAGVLDLVWNIANGLPIPETLPYANHLIIFFGPDPTWKTTLIFAICHIPLFALVCWLPLDKWFTKWGLEKEIEVKKAA